MIGKSRCVQVGCIHLGVVAVATGGLSIAGTHDGGTVRVVSHLAPGGGSLAVESVG